MPRQRLTGAVLEAIDLAYSAADGDAEWPQFLAATAELVGADNAYLSHIDHRRLELDCKVLDGGRWDPVALERYRRMIPVDALMPALHRRLLSPVMCSDVVAPAVRETSPQYREIFPALEIQHSLATALEKSETSGVYLGLTRSSRKQPYSPRQAEMLRVVGPHVRRAVKLERQRRFLALQESFGLEIAKRLPFPVLIADRNCRLAFSNAAADRLLRAGDAIRLIGGRLACRRPAEQAQLSAVVRALESTMSDSATIVLSGRESCALALVSSVSGAVDESRAAGPMALILVHEPARAMRVELEPVLRTAFGLPPSLARFAAVLADGHSLQDAAKILGLTEASARIYMKRVLERTEAPRQGDLIRKLTLLACLLPLTSRNRKG